MASCTLEVRMTKSDNRFPHALASFYPVEALCKQVTLVVGSHRVESLDSVYFRLYDTWHRNADQRERYKRLGNFDPATLDTKQEMTETLYLPLVFGFTLHPAHGLPVSMLTDPIRLDFAFAAAEEIGISPKNFTAVVHCDFVHSDESQSWLKTTPPHILLPTVQVYERHLRQEPQSSGLHTQDVKLPFKGAFRNLMWMMVETTPPPPNRTFHARGVGDPSGTYVALQPSCHTPSGLAMQQIISEKLAPVYAAGLSDDTHNIIVYEGGGMVQQGHPPSKTECRGKSGNVLLHLGSSPQ